MHTRFCCTYWGCENDTPAVFVDKVLSAGYEGIEINLPETGSSFTRELLKLLEQVRANDPGFLFIPQQLTAPGTGAVDAYISNMKKRMMELCALQPTFINSQTGADYLSFDDNCRVLEAALTISSQTGVRILQETHRGRFSFHAPTLLPYLQRFPELELVADFSHFCAVSESLLQEQDAVLQQIIPHVAHIHARIGHQQGAQVNDPFAPEWSEHFSVFKTWWRQILAFQQQKGATQFSITPEFGPAPYMPALPFTQQPIGNQWEINRTMMQHLKQAFK